MNEQPLVYEGPWAEVCHAIDELEWYVSRKMDLGRQTDQPPSGKVWADLMDSDLRDLRAAIEAARKSERK